MAVICTLYFMCGIMEVFVSALRAIGRSVLPMVVSIAGVVGVRILWIYTVFRMWHTPFVLYLSYPVSWLFTLIVHMICYLVLRKKTFVMLRNAHIVQPLVQPPEEGADCVPCDAPEESDLLMELAQASLAAKEEMLSQSAQENHENP